MITGDAPIEDPLITEEEIPGNYESELGEPTDQGDQEDPENLITSEEITSEDVGSQQALPRPQKGDYLALGPRGLRCVRRLGGSH